jgi:hypothetical protein
MNIQMNKTLFFIAGLLMYVSVGNTYGQDWGWARSADLNKAYSVTSANEGWPVASDKEGNVVMAMWNSADSMVLGSYRFHSLIYKKQVVVARYDAWGELLWAMGSSNGNSVPIDIALDHNDNVYLYGYFTGDSIQFGTHSIVRTNSSITNSCYIVKFDKGGNVLWTAKAGSIANGTGKQAFGSIAIDNTDNVYVSANYTNSSLMFGTTSITNSGNDDISLVKYNGSGSVIWAKKFGGAGYDRVSGLDISPNNEVYITGEFNSPTLDFGNVALSYSSSYPVAGTNHFNVFLAQLTTDGTTNWATQSTGDTRVMCVAADSTGDVYIGGMIADTVASFGGSSILHKNNHPYLIKFNVGGGSVARVQVFNQSSTVGINPHPIWGIAIDPCNNAWVSGGMDTAVGNGVYLDTSIIMPAPAGSMDPMFIACYDPKGALLDYSALLSGGKENSGLATDGYGNVFLCGNFAGLDQFILGSDTLFTDPNMTSCYFLTRYNPASYCDPSAIRAAGHTSNGIQLYPNPANTLLNISAGTKIRQITIYSVLGKTVFAGAFNADAAQINIADLPAGVYLVRVNDQTVRRFVKQ